MKDAELLRSAAEYLRREGWIDTEGSFWSGACLMQSLACAYGLTKMQWRYVTPPAALIQRILTREPRTATAAPNHQAGRTLVVLFNDRYCKNGAEAITVLEEAALLAEYDDAETASVEQPAKPKPSEGVWYSHGGCGECGEGSTVYIEFSDATIKFSSWVDTITVKVEMITETLEEMCFELPPIGVTQKQMAGERPRPPEGEQPQPSDPSLAAMSPPSAAIEECVT